MDGLVVGIIPGSALLLLQEPVLLLSLLVAAGAGAARSLPPSLSWTDGQADKGSDRRAGREAGPQQANTWRWIIAWCGCMKDQHTHRRVEGPPSRT